MAKYLWRDEFCTGHADIDGQHQQLFCLLDELYDAVCAGDGANVVEAVVTELVTYTRTHFYQEESLMREFNYPGIDEHLREHQWLLQRVDDKMAALRRGEKIMQCGNCNRILLHEDKVATGA